VAFEATVVSTHAAAVNHVAAEKVTAIAVGATLIAVGAAGALAQRSRGAATGARLASR
jgi:hypothetical protein